MAPLMIGVVPFALIAGAAAVRVGMSGFEAAALSLTVFAGLAQVAVVELMGTGAPLPVIIATALIVNLRFAMYSASLAPHFGRFSAGPRSLMAYLLTDQAYAVTIVRFDREGLSRHGHWFYLGAGIMLWVVWQASHAVGALVGARVPDGWSLDFAIPLTLIALLMPMLRGRGGPAAAAAAALVAVAAFAMPLNLGPIVAVIAGVFVGLVAETRRGR